MTTSLDPSRDWMLIPTWPPPAKDLARRYPNQTYVHTIPWSDVLAEEREITQALRQGGYRKADRIEPLPAAVDALIDDLHDIAIEHDIDGYRVGDRLNADGNVDVVMVFREVKDAVFFKLLLG